jgi:hypothetical protein
LTLYSLSLLDQLLLFRNEVLNLIEVRDTLADVQHRLLVRFVLRTRPSFPPSSRAVMLPLHRRAHPTAAGHSTLQTGATSASSPCEESRDFGVKPDLHHNTTRQIQISHSSQRF